MKIKLNISTKKILVILAIAAMGFLAYVFYLDVKVRAKFEGKRWSLPAKVYARPLELYPGLGITPAEIRSELDLLEYQETVPSEEPGTYNRQNSTLNVFTRPFTFGDGLQGTLELSIQFEDNRVERLVNLSDDSPLDLVRLDPVLIGGIYTDEKEDRFLVRFDEVPQTVVDALLAVEDRRYFSHHGIDPKGIARSIVATASGEGIQGGSTLTQQLVKNFYLNSERTLRRKFTEALMALLLELRYDKQEILETYINEVYLGQDGNRAIHGFGLASFYFFGKSLSNLNLHEAALLVGMLKGPSYYNPRSQPERALQRRNLVLRLMADEGHIGNDTLHAAQLEPLDVIKRPQRGTSPHPAFLNLVHRQLRQDYRDEDLRSEGLQIFTTLDPNAQRVAEEVLKERLAALETAHGMPTNSLQGAVIVTSTQNAEIQAVVGGRDPRFEGFNRALDAQRPIGSLVKPIVYLTALQQPQRFTLVTRLDDSPYRLRQRGTDDWTPNNYDNTFHGEVALIDALAQSYNAATARLGMELGVSRVMENLQRLGLNRTVQVYPSSMLGSNALSPLEVTQVYQTIASGGFRTPLRTVREILTADGEPLQRYPLNVEQVVDGAPIHLVTVAMQEVVDNGTAQGLRSYLAPSLRVAGKTGTTDDFRDSWFAGFTGDRLAVVWVGYDDNQPTGHTGASGAMTIWGQAMKRLNPEPLLLAQPDTVEMLWIDSVSGLLSDAGCLDTVELPFIEGSAPTEVAPCEPRSTGDSIKRWFKRMFH